MPPKDKAKAAAKSKAAEDKTFGLKNKNKSKAVQQYVKQVESSQAAQNTQKAARIAAASGVVNVKDKKKAEEERKAEMAALFAVTIKQPKVPPGVDPKSMVCEFFRHGQCTKAFKCKFSHDLNVEKKGPKIDLFQDKRDGAEEEEEGMEDWDQAELERVVKEKHGAEKPSNATTIICKFFLDAVEKHQYGWFWKCPNGAECKYRHALPPGYVLKSQMKELLEEEARNVRDIAEQIEEERAKIDARTPITEEVFAAWRQRKVEVRRARKAAEEEERKKKGIMTGREIFMQDGFVYEDDAGASGADDLKREGQDEEEEAIRQMLENARNAAARAKERAETEPSSIKRPKADDDEEDEEEEEEEEDEEAGGAGAAEEPGGSGAGPSGSGAGPSGATQLQPGDDEELFGGDDDDDDDMLEDDEDLEDDELDELEQGIKGTQLGGEAGPSKS